MAGEERSELSDLASAGAFLRNRHHSLSEHGHLGDVSGRQEVHPAAHAPSACMPEPQSQSFEGGGSEQEGGSDLFLADIAEEVKGGLAPVPHAGAPWDTC